MTSNERRADEGRHHFRPPDPADALDVPAPVDAGTDYPLPPRPWYLQIAGQWPLFLSLSVVAAGILVAGVGYWRRGSSIAGAGVLVAAALRLVLPEKKVGLLESRSKAIDVAVTTILGVGIILLAWIVSPTRK